MALFKNLETHCEALPMGDCLLSGLAVLDYGIGDEPRGGAGERTRT